MSSVSIIIPKKHFGRVLSALAFSALLLLPHTLLGENLNPPSESCAALTRSACTIFYRQTSSALKQTEYHIFDTRSVNDFNQNSVGNAQHALARNLKFRTDLKDKKLLIIPQSDAFDSLQTLCEDLASAGFTSVSILQGGLYSAQASGLTLVKPTSEFEGPIEIKDPLSLFSEFSKSQPVIIFEKPVAPNLRLKLPGQIQELPQGRSVQVQFELLVAEINSSRRTLDLRPILFIPENKYSPLLRLLEESKQKTNTPNLYILKVGHTALEQFAHTHEQIVSAFSKPKLRCQ
jgi:hypothetical protein